MEQKEVEGKIIDRSGRWWPKSNKVIMWVVERTGEKGSGKYVGDDKIAMKKKLTYKEKAFVDEYLRSHNSTAAFRAAKWTLANPEEYLDSDRSNGSQLRRKEKIKEYLMEKIMTDAAECLDIQMDLIRNTKIPAAVRHDAIKDRLNRMWVGKEKEESNEFTGIGEVTITIKHKKPDVIDMDTDVEVLDWEENNGKSIQSTIWDDWETSWSMGSTDWQQD